MVYKHVKTGGLYQVIAVGARMALLNPGPPLDPAAEADMAKVVIARSDVEHYYVYLKPVYNEAMHWPKVADGTLQLAADRQLRHGEKCVVYRAEDGSWWVRMEDEFFDGRFVAVTGAVQ